MKLQAAFIGLCLAVTPVFAQDGSVSTTHIKGNLHLLQGRGGNVLASVGDDGVLLVDDDFADLQPAYEQAIAELGNARARFVINTHWHADHTGGNAAWGESGSVIVAHDNVRQRMSTRQVNKIFDRVTEPSPASALPFVTYGDSLALHMNGDTVEVQHYPNGHTDGDSVVFFAESNVVHMGDHFFKDRFPFVDIASGGSVEGLVSNIAALLDKVGANTVIVPGHGSLANREDLRRYHEMLAATTTEVRGMMKQGMKLQAIQEKGLDDRWDSWGGGFINEATWIAFIVASSQQ